MITNFNSKTSRKDDAKLLAWIVFGFLIVAWLCTPPGNKFLQICFWGNNTQLFMSKLIHNSDNTEYKFHRNNAVYLAKMYSNKKKALDEMNNAIQTLPTYASDSELKKLYKDIAEIRLMAGDYKGALNDFINSGDIQFNDNLKVAMLFKEQGNYREALSYCNSILDVDATAYAGFACLSDLYESIGRYDVALNVWNLAIDRRPNNPKSFIDRAKIKKKVGDISGYTQDIEKAKEFSPTIDLEESITYDALHPKMLTLTIN